MSALRTFALLQCRTYSSSRLVRTTSYCLPKEPTWSVKILTEVPKDPEATEEITIEQMSHLHKLAQLKMPEKPKQIQQLKEDINHIAHFIKHVKNASIPSDTEPLAGLWQDHVSQTLRPDEPIFTEEHARGRELLKHAKTTSGNFYVAKASLPSHEE
ncbi:hypothetical protein NQZ79_g5178 [Umbelopsis isabellina]|nr:hypothetical protein NQZ79_g5178 [Umbelopsis isabellina]